jgi:putative transposase
MREDTRQRKHAIAGLQAISGEEWMLGTLVRVMSSGKQALDAVMLEMGRMVAESVMLIEREEIAGPDYYPSDPALQKWAHKEGSIFIGDQKVRVKRPRLRHVVHGEVPVQSYVRLHSPGQFSEELLEKILRGVSAQKYKEIVLDAAHVFGVSPSSVSRKLGALTAKKLKEFQERSLADFTPFAVFFDTIHRGGESFLVALGVDLSGEKRALGFWQGSSENHEICEALFNDL